MVLSIFTDTPLAQYRHDGDIDGHVPWNGRVSTSFRPRYIRFTPALTHAHTRTKIPLAVAALFPHV